jgi:hypothetical protein
LTQGNEVKVTMDIKEKEKRMAEAQEILDWAIMHLNGGVKCKVMNYKNESYQVQFLTKENELIMPVQILLIPMNLATQSEGIWPRLPIECGHLFRFMMATPSERSDAGVF